MEKDHPENTLDASGLLCPLPVLRARKRLQSMASGAVLTLRATDPMAAIDIPHFCTEQGHGLESHVREGETHIFRIKRK